jgi:hypothetical protein
MIRTRPDFVGWSGIDPALRRQSQSEVGIVNQTKTNFVLGWVAWLASMGCAPEVLPLGDEPLGGSGGASTGAGGKSVLPAGGATQVDPPAEGGATLIDPPIQGGATQVDPPSEGGATQDCFAPQHRPELAVEPGAVGCACDDEPEECVRTQYDGRPWDVALYCIDGKWESAEDGVCWTGAACVVEGTTYPSGARRVPTPYSGCNECRCMNGELVDCTNYKCADAPCPEGTFAARKCVDCGSGPGGCGTYEIGCFPGAECQSGMCGLVCI